MLALPQLDIHSDEPIYRQLYELVKREILSGRLVAGERLPPTRELAGTLGVNRATVAGAYELLESEGLIHGHVGRGSYVAAVGVAGGADWESRFVLPRTAEAPAAGGDGVVSFVTSRLAEELLPLEDFRISVMEALEGRGAAAVLELGAPLGYGPFRAWLTEEARRTGVARKGDDVLVTNGCQQALDLLARLFCAAGDTVLVEDPVYPGLRQVFERAGVRVTGIPMTPEGADAEAAGRLAAREAPKLIVVTPNFQNPTGLTLSLASRQAMLRVAREARVPLVEIDIYSDLRYKGAALPALKQIDESGQVIQIRSFSKLAFPGLRTGWVAGPQAVVRRLAEVKQVTDLHSDQLSQAALLRFAESGRLDAHKKRMVAGGSERLEAALAACERYLPEGTQFTRPEGGMNLWVRLAEPLDAGEALERAQREGVSYLPGRYFAVTRPQAGGLRLSFAGLKPESIEIGIRVLGKVFEEETQRARASGLKEPRPAIV